MTSIRTTSPPSQAMLGTSMLVMAAIFTGLRPLFGRGMAGDGLNNFVIAFYQSLLTMAFLGPVAIASHKNTPEYKRMSWLAAGIGMFLGLGAITYFESIQRLPISTVTAIYFSSPAMVIAYTAFTERRWPRPRSLGAIAAVLLGCVFVVGVDFRGGTATPADILIALVAPISWAAILIGLAGPLSGLNSNAATGLISTGSLVPVVIGLVLFPSTGFVPQSSTGWWSLLGLVGLSGVFTHLLWTHGIPKAGSERASVIGGLEIVTAVLIGWFIYAEALTPIQGVGILLIGLAIWLSKPNKS